MALNNMTYNPFRISGTGSESGDLDFADIFGQGDTELEVLVKVITGTVRVSVNQAPNATNSPTLDGSDTTKNTVVVTLKNNQTRLYYAETSAAAWEMWVMR